MLAKKIITIVSLVAIPVSLVISAVVNAEPYSPYPGTLATKLVSVNSASSIEVSAETWPGFTRTFRISLSGIKLPQNSPDAKLCERKLAKEALDFVTDYLSNAAKIEIHNMTMETSTDQNVQAELYTDKGNLGNALKNHGLARSTNIKDDEEPWC